MGDAGRECARRPLADAATSSRRSCFFSWRCLQASVPARPRRSRSSTTRGTARRGPDGSYQHWSQHGHEPPDDIASSYYPARGLYSSTDRRSSRRRWTRSGPRGSTRSSSRGGGRAPPRTCAARGDRGRAQRRDRGRGAPRAVRRANRREHRRRHRLPAAATASRRSTSTARSTSPSATGRRRRAQLHAGASGPLRADGARRRRSRGGLRRRLHLRHRHLRRQHVPPPLCRGTRRCTCSARRRSGPATTPDAAATTRA